MISPMATKLCNIQMADNWMSANVVIKTTEIRKLISVANESKTISVAVALRLQRMYVFIV